ncbi:MAG: thioredoxin family protein [Chloroflexi bacterium]|nr:thioredoxin family protein [Chloroflexota bacterium]
MSTIAEVITPERYKKGFTYAEYLPQTGEFQPQFQNVEKAFKLPPEDAEHYRKNAGKLSSMKVLVLVGDTSPDVWRALPVMDQITKAAGIEMRIFRRDDNQDIMDLFLNQGKFRSIPVVAFFDKNLRPLGHWIERPAVAHKLMEGWRAELAAKNLSQDEVRAELKRRREPYVQEWCRDAARELREWVTKIAPKA